MERQWESNFTVHLHVHILLKLLLKRKMFYFRVLPVMVCGSDEEVSDFTRRVHLQLAEHMNVQATPHTSADKVEYAKRKLFIQPHSKF